MRIFDAHIHSTFSDGALDVAGIVEVARMKEMQIGISDHVGSMYPLNSDSRVLAYLDAIEEYPVKRSLELNVNEFFSLPDSIMGKFDYRLGGVHFEGKRLVGVDDVTADEPEKVYG